MRSGTEVIAGVKRRTCEQCGAEMDVSPAEATNTNVGGQGPPMQTCDWEQSLGTIIVGEQSPPRVRTMNKQNEDNEEEEKRSLEKIQQSAGCEKLRSQTKALKTQAINRGKTDNALDERSILLNQRRVYRDISD